MARGNADWYQLLDLCALTDTLIADSDGIYHPGLHNDRLVLGLKGTMREAELHVWGQVAWREPAQGGQGRAAPAVAGRLGVRRDWGCREYTPDEAIADAIATVFSTSRRSPAPGR